MKWKQQLALLCITATVLLKVSLKSEAPQDELWLREGMLSGGM